MKYQKFDVWERMKIVDALDTAASEETMLTIDRCIRVVSVVRLSEEESKSVGLKEVAPQQYMWDDGEYERMLEFEDSDWTYMVDRVKSSKGWPPNELTVRLRKKLDTPSLTPIEE